MYLYKERLSELSGGLHEVVPGADAAQEVLPHGGAEPPLVLVRGDHRGLPRAQVLLHQVFQLLVPGERPDVVWEQTFLIIYFY